MAASARIKTSTREKLVTRVSTLLEKQEMAARLSYLSLGNVEGNGSYTVVALVTDLVCISHGEEGLQPTGLTGLLIG